MAGYYLDQASYRGEVDHPALIRRLDANLADGTSAGYALSCSSKSLRFLLPLMPESHRVCSWMKTIGANPSTYGIHSTWEAVIVVGGRQRKPGVRDWLACPPDRGGVSDLTGRKPILFCCWLFDLLGMVPGDLLADLYPGSGAVGRAWSAVQPSREPGMRFLPKELR